MKTIKLLFAVVIASIYYTNPLQAQCFITAGDSGNFYCNNTPVTLTVADQTNAGYTIYWGDGNSTNSIGNSWYFYTHSYPNQGFYFPYLVSNCGDTIVPNIGFNGNYYYVADSCYFLFRVKPSLI